jgi:hypothetical protein
MAVDLDRAAERVEFLLKGLTPRRLRARVDGPKVFANSVPKSGTNLLTHSLSQFPMLRPSFEHVTMNSNRRDGVEELERKARRTGRGQYTSGHVFYTGSNAEIVERHGLRQVLMVRDPRDVVTSHFHYVTEKNTEHRLTAHYRSLPDDDARLMASIRGVSGEHTRDGDRLESIGEWMDAFLAWRAKPYVTVVRFEDLIGPQGGGDADRQREAIESVADHLDVSLSTAERDHVAENTFSTGSSTFRKGLIGDWRNHFTPDHVSAFKREANEWLVELGYEDGPDWTV